MLGILPFITTACDNDDEPEVNEVQLSPEAQKDIHTRFEGAIIKAVRRLQGDPTPGTEVDLVDIHGNEVSIFYQHSQDPSLTVTHFASFDNLPEPVKNAFMKSHYKDIDKQQIKNIECDDYAVLNKKMYKLEFYANVGKWENRYTMTLFNEDGFMLPDYHLGEGLINDSWKFKVINMEEVHFIESHYGKDIRAFNHDRGYSSYYVMDKDVLKYVRFRDHTWKGTTYLLPESQEVPEDILKELYQTAPDFEYTEIYLVETPNGQGYKFCNEIGESHILGDMFTNPDVQ